MASYRKIGRNWFYRYVDADGVQRERKGCPDRRETEGMGAHAEAEAEAATKNGAPATLPLPDDVADDLFRFVATVPDGAPVFTLPAKGAEMLKADLAPAGIPYIDAAGLVFDFHALRCECATLADQAGSSPRTIQALMRHSTLELTGKYTRPRAHDLEAATAGLPSLRPDAPETEAARMTGTEGPAVHMKKLLSLPLPYGGDGSWRTLADLTRKPP